MAVDGGHGLQQHEGHRLGVQARQQNGCTAHAAAAVRTVRSGYWRGSLIQAGDVSMNMMAMDMVVSGRGVAMAVNMDMVVPAVRRARPVMIDGPRAVQHEGKRRHDRQRGRDTPEQGLHGANQASTGFTLP
jgi:hypothetical protein